MYGKCMILCKHFRTNRVLFCMHAYVLALYVKIHNNLIDTLEPHSAPVGVCCRRDARRYGAVMNRDEFLQLKHYVTDELP